MSTTTIFSVEIDTDNDVFQEPNSMSRELASLLRRIATSLEDRGTTRFEGNLLDRNGNSVGAYGFMAEDDPS